MIDTVDLSSIDKFLEATGNYYRVFQIVLRGRMGNFDGGGTFYQVVGTWGVILTIRSFFRTKNNIL